MLQSSRYRAVTGKEKGIEQAVAIKKVLLFRNRSSERIDKSIER